MFHVVKDPNTSAEIFIQDLTKISELAYRWKMSFNLHPLKQAQEVFFLIMLQRRIIQALNLMVTRYKI